MITRVPKIDFYVYMYLRSKSSSTAPVGTPYYIGKGRAKRAWNPRLPTRKPSDDKNIIIFEKDLTEDEAFAIENALVLKYGRIDNGTGILRNLTNGGEGATGRICSEIHRQRLSESKTGDKSPRGMLGKHHSEESKKAIRDKNIGEANSQYGKHHSEEMRKLISERCKGKQLGKLRGPQSAERIAKCTGPNNSQYGKKQELKECPHCGKIGGRTMVRWHFDKCKEKS